MEMPRVQEQHEKLKALAGTWSGAETMHPSPWDPKGGTATGKIESRIDLDGFFLVSDYVQERNGQVSYRGHGVYGWDPMEQSYVMFWFDSIGTPPSAARGRFHGNTLTLEHRTPMGHSRYVYTLERDGRYSFRIEHSQDAKSWVCFMEGDYSRK